MIKHIVFWNLSATDAAAREQAAQEIVDAFDGLENRIPELLSISIERNVVESDSNADLALVSEFESLEALDAYLKHPDHEAAAAVSRARVSKRNVIDYEF